MSSITPHAMSIMEREQHRSELIDIEGRRVIRSFSNEWGASDTLGEALKENTERTEMRGYFESPATAENMEERLSVFTETQMSYIKDHANPPKEKKWLGLKKSLKGKSEFGNIADATAETFEELGEFIKEKEGKWSSSSGKASQYFSKVCTTLDSHKELFKIFPTDNMYVSFFCGSINILVGASITHQKVAERLSSGISEVCGDVSSCVKLLKIMNVESMRQRLADIYLQVFEFFQLAMKWYGSNKFLPSLDGGLHSKFDSKIAKIRDAVACLHRDGDIGGHAEVREVRLTGEATQAMVFQALKVGIENQQTSIETQQLWKGYDQRFRKLENVIMRAVLGKSLSSSLQDSFKADFPLLTERLSPGSYEAGMGILDFPVESNRLEKINTKLEVISFLKSLQRFVALVTVEVPSRSMFPSFADGLLIHSLQQWLSAENSQFLWIVGPADVCTPSGMALIASRTVDTIKASDVPIPVIFHFCKRPFVDEIFQEQTQDEAAMMWLVYNLITQLVGFLAPEIDNGLNLSQNRLSKLDGTSASWITSLEILEELLLFAPPLLFCVIDGLNKFDLEIGSTKCQEFLKTLRNSQRVAESNRKVLKVLLTTSGLSDALVEEIPIEERHFAKVDMATAEYRQENLISLSL